MMKFRNSVLFLTLFGLFTKLTHGSLHLGNVALESHYAEHMDPNLLIIVFYNECSGYTIDDRQSGIREAFSCLTYKTRVEGPTLTAMFFDSIDSSCMDNPDINLDSYCIYGVSYDTKGDFDASGTCRARSTADDDLPGPRALYIDGLDLGFGSPRDESFTYYDLPMTVDLYVFDSGIRSTHEEFSGRVVNLALYSGEEYWSDNYAFAYHGTSVASNGGGDSYGSSNGQRIYNVNIAGAVDFGGFGYLYASTCFTLLGLQDSLNNMISTGRRGVINMSFTLFLTDSQKALFDDLASSINNFGSILVAAAGNGFSPNCVYPALSDQVISVGAFETRIFTFFESWNVALFSNYGDCVDVYGPGVNVPAANSTSDDSYHIASGTSFASPIVAGVVANILLECEDSGYEDPCTLTALKTRFQHEDTSLFLNGPATDFVNTVCNDGHCRAIYYKCQEPVFPFGIEECGGTSGHCDESEAGNCMVYHSNVGCSQCEAGSFKKSYNYPCVSCTGTFGASCVVCNDFSGCSQCTANDYTRVYDADSGLYYCEPSPCLDDDNKCQVCNNGKCSQCIWPYTLNNDQKSCS